MYRVYLDDLVILDTHNSIGMIEAEVVDAPNSTGSFRFTIESENPAYRVIKDSLRSHPVRVECIDQTGTDTIWLGRVDTMEPRQDGTIEVECHNLLSLLERSVQPVAEYHTTLSGYITALLDVHNSQMHLDIDKVYPGVIDDSLESGTVFRFTDYADTLQNFKDDLINSLGGYMFINQDENGLNRLHYRAGFLRDNVQGITFGDNMLTYEGLIDGSDIATAIMPVGARLTETVGNEANSPAKRVTIESVNNGRQYITSYGGIRKYGTIMIPLIFEDVTTPEALLKKAQDALEQKGNPFESVTLTAVDLADFGMAEQHIRLLDRIHCESAAHDLSEDYVVAEIRLNLLDPSKNEYTLGGRKASYAQSVIGVLGEAGQTSIYTGVGDGAVTTDKLADGSVTSDKLAAGILGVNTSSTIDATDIGMGAISFLRSGYLVQASWSGQASKDIPANVYTLDDELPPSLRPDSVVKLPIDFGDGKRGSITLSESPDVVVAVYSNVPADSQIDFIGHYIVT